MVYTHNSFWNRNVCTLNCWHLLPFDASSNVSRYHYYWSRQNEFLHNAFLGYDQLAVITFLWIYPRCADYRCYRLDREEALGDQFGDTAKMVAYIKSYATAMVIASTSAPI